MSDEHNPDAAEDYTLLMDHHETILVVDDEEVMREVLVDLLEDAGFEVKTAGSAEDALEVLKESELALMIVDKNLPAMNGLELMAAARDVSPDTEFMMLTGFASYDSAVEALRLGAADYIEKPINDVRVFEQRVRSVLERQRLNHENRVLSAHLVDAHNELNKVVDHLGEAITDQQKRYTYLDALAKRVGRDLRIQNTELTKALREAVAPLKEGRDRAASLARAGQADAGQLEGLQKVLDRALEVVTARLKRASQFRTEPA